MKQNLFLLNTTLLLLTAWLPGFAQMTTSKPLPTYHPVGDFATQLATTKGGLAVAFNTSYYAQNGIYQAEIRKLSYAGDSLWSVSLDSFYVDWLGMMPDSSILVLCTKGEAFVQDSTVYLKRITNSGILTTHIINYYPQSNSAVHPVLKGDTLWLGYLQGQTPTITAYKVSTNQTVIHKSFAWANGNSQFTNFGIASHPAGLFMFYLIDNGNLTFELWADQLNNIADTLSTSKLAIRKTDRIRCYGAGSAYAIVSQSYTGDSLFVLHVSKNMQILSDFHLKPSMYATPFQYEIDVYKNFLFLNTGNVSPTASSSFGTFNLLDSSYSFTDFPTLPVKIRTSPSALYLKNRLYIISNRKQANPPVPFESELIIQDTALVARVSTIPNRSELNIFPNPGQGSFTIRGNAPLQWIEIQSLAGQPLLKRFANNANSLQMDALPLAAGMYLVVVTDAEGNRNTLRWTNLVR